MCLIVFAYDHHPEYQLIFAANRDEFYNRPTAAADFWEEHPEVLAGRDLKAGGTWMGVTRVGRWAAVTNFRAAGEQVEDAPSRGALVRSYLRGDQEPQEFMEEMAPKADRYNGFNLFTGDLQELWYLSNRNGTPETVTPGIHGISNHLLDTPWPKVERAKRLLEERLDAGDVTPESLLELLADRRSVPDEELPDTGVPIEWERTLSSVFITSPSYGTRSSTVLLISRSGEVTFVERSYEAEGKNPSSRRYDFEIEPAESYR